MHWICTKRNWLLCSSCERETLNHIFPPPSQSQPQCLEGSSKHFSESDEESVSVTWTLTSDCANAFKLWSHKRRIKPIDLLKTLANVLYKTLGILLMKIRFLLNITYIIFESHIHNLFTYPDLGPWIQRKGKGKTSSSVERHGRRLQVLCNSLSDRSKSINCINDDWSLQEAKYLAAISHFIPQIIGSYCTKCTKIFKQNLSNLFLAHCKV